MRPLPKRSRSRVTRDGMIYEQRILALRRLEAQRYRPPLPPPSRDEVAESVARWARLRRLI